YILQLSMSGRQQDLPGVENLDLRAPPGSFYRRPLSSTDSRDSFHGLAGRAATRTEIKQLIQWFVDGAERARRAGVDGIELHSSNGYLFTQFLSSAINDRLDEYGGSLRGRAEFLIEVIRAIRDKVGDGLFLMVKLSAVEGDNAIFRWRKQGNTLEESAQIAQWAETEERTRSMCRPAAYFPILETQPERFRSKRRGATMVRSWPAATGHCGTICCSATCPRSFFGFGSRAKQIS